MPTPCKCSIVCVCAAGQDLAPELSSPAAAVCDAVGAAAGCGTGKLEGPSPISDGQLDGPSPISDAHTQKMSPRVYWRLAAETSHRKRCCTFKCGRCPESNACLSI